MGLERERNNRRKQFEVAIVAAWRAMMLDAALNDDDVDAREIRLSYEEWMRTFEGAPLPERNEKSLG